MRANDRSNNRPTGSRLIAYFYPKLWIRFTCLMLLMIFTTSAFALTSQSDQLPEVFVGSSGNSVLLSIAFDGNIENNTALELNLEESYGVASNINIVERKDLSRLSERVFAIYFDIAADVEPGKVEKLVFILVSNQFLSYDKGVLRFSFRTIEAEQPKEELGDEYEQPKEEPSEQKNKHVYVLADIKYMFSEWDSTEDYESIQVGFIHRSPSPTYSKIEMIQCTECPDRIVLGESFQFKLEARVRYDEKKYGCDRTPKDRWPPYLNIIIGDYKAETRGKGLHFPDCQELGVKKRKDTTKNVRGVILNQGMMYDPVGLTLEERVTLSADFTFKGDGTDYDAVFNNDPAYIYLAKYRSDGTLSKNTEEDKITVEYSNTKLKTPEYLMSKELKVYFAGFHLIYTIQINGQPNPINVVSSGIPPDFNKPHLSGTIVADEEQNEEIENTGKSAKKTVPSFKKATAKEVISKIRNAGLTPKINIVKADSPDQTGRIRSLDPPHGTELKPGTTVFVDVFGPYVKTSIVPIIKGTTVKDVMSKIKKAGLKPKINIVKADSPDQTGRIRSLDPPQGTELKPGMTVFVDVFAPYVKTIKVPNVEGSTEKEARNLLASVGLKLRIADSKTTNDRLLAGTIKSQIPEVGTIVKKGKTIKLVVYKKSRKNYCENGTWDSYKGRCVTDREKALARLSCPFCERPYYDEARGKARCVCASGCDIDSTISDYCMKKDKLARIKKQRRQDQENRESLQEQDQRRRDENQRKRVEEQRREGEQEEARKQEECQKHLSQLNNSVKKKKRQLEQMIYLTSAYSSNCDPKEITAAQQGKWKKGGSSGSTDTGTGSTGSTGSTGDSGGTGGIIYDGDYGPEIGSGPCAGILGSTPDTKECNPGKYK